MWQFLGPPVLIAAESGLSKVTDAMPIITAMSTGGPRNCHTEMPEARATSSSSLRVRLRNTAMDPNSTQNGSTCSDTAGVRSSERKATDHVVTPAILPVRRSSSTKSITKTRLKIVANTATIMRKKRDDR